MICLLQIQKIFPSQIFLFGFAYQTGKRFIKKLEKMKGAKKLLKV
jgi:hypothetical protein